MTETNDPSVNEIENIEMGDSCGTKVLRNMITS